MSGLRLDQDVSAGNNLKYMGFLIFYCAVLDKKKCFGNYRAGAYDY